MSLALDSSAIVSTAAMISNPADFISPPPQPSHFFNPTPPNTDNDNTDVHFIPVSPLSIPSTISTSPSSPSPPPTTPQPTRSGPLQLLKYYFFLLIGAFSSFFSSSQAAHRILGSSTATDELPSSGEKSLSETDTKPILSTESTPVRTSPRLRMRTSSSLTTSSQQTLIEGNEGADSTAVAAPNSTFLRRRVTSSSTPPPSRPLSTHHLTKTLVLDLDETLIHSTSRGRAGPSSSSRNYRVVEVTVDRHAVLYYVHKRPHVDYFLRKVAEWYRVVVFTASMEEYAGPVIDWLEESVRKGGRIDKKADTSGLSTGSITTLNGSKGVFSARLFRPHCTLLRPPSQNQYTKDLALIEPDLSRIALVDNSPASYALNPENGIPIDAWFSDPRDEALLDLLPFLDALRFCEDMRSVLRLRGA